MKNIYDTIIIGSGVAGTFAAYKISQKYKNNKTLLVELGARPGKRRRQCEGFLGTFPTGDGKIYSNDLNKVMDITSKRSAETAYKYFINILGEVGETKVTKDKLPNSEAQKKITKAGFSLELNDHIQWKPESIHKLSRLITTELEGASNISMSFDNEVFGIARNKKAFVVYTAQGDFNCKNLIFCVGRSGWRWANKIYKDLGILVSDDLARFGIRVEIPSHYMKEFNKSHCTLTKNDLEIGPLSWQGTVIPEDHADLVISAFRSNEQRWSTDKVSFSLLSSRLFEGNGCAQTERLGKLAFLLSNDRIGRERIRTFMKRQSQLSLLPEYEWMHGAINELAELIPTVLTKGSYHVPDIIALPGKIRLGQNLESEIPGLYIAGESAGIRGIAAAGTMGCIAADSACR